MTTNVQKQKEKEKRKGNRQILEAELQFSLSGIPRNEKSVFSVKQPWLS